MKVIFSVIAGVIQLSAARFFIHGEDGSVKDVNDINMNATEYAAVGVGSSFPIEKCFISVCQSSYVRDTLVSECKASSSNYANCGDLAYHSTYYKLKSGTSTLKNSGNTFTYGAAQTKYSSKLIDTQTFHNYADSTSNQAFAKTITKQFTHSWTDSAVTAISESIKVLPTAIVPSSVQREYTAKVAFPLQINTQLPQSHSVTQTWAVDETVAVPPNSCVTGCMKETDSTVTAPFSFTGHLSGTYSANGYSSLAAQCCYVRPGGTNDCSGLGSKTGSAGWSTSGVAGFFVYRGKMDSLPQCLGFGYNGNDAVFSGNGNYAGGMVSDVSIGTSMCGTPCEA